MKSLPQGTGTCDCLNHRLMDGNTLEEEMSKPSPPMTLSSQKFNLYIYIYVVATFGKNHICG